MPSTSLAHGAEMPLWGDRPAPGSENVSLTESVLRDDGAPGDPLRTLRGIAVPTVTAYLPFKPNGTAAIVAGGGGYVNLVIDKEGTDIARWLCTIGVTAFVLKHRLPGEGHADGKFVPLQDAQRALRLIRANAPVWGLAPDRIGVVGLSSGGHLGAMLGTSFARQVYAPRDDIDRISARPDFMILGYGPFSQNARACLIKPDQAPLPPPEKQDMYDEFPVDRQVSAETPPAFLFNTDVDKVVSPINGIRMYLAMREAGRPVELHIFQDGVHGVAIRNTAGLPVARWPDMARDWLAALERTRS